MSGGMIAVVAILFFASSILGMLIGRKMFSSLNKSNDDNEKK